MEPDGQVVHCYPQNGSRFSSSVEMVQHSIETKTPLVAICGDEWMPESLEYLTGEPCPECLEANPGAFKKKEKK